MPKRRHLLPMRDASMQKVSQMFQNVLRIWIGKLCLAQTTGIRHYRQQVEYVMNECKTVNEQLASMPIHISEDLTLVLVRVFVIEISAHHKRDRGFKSVTRRDEDLHNAVCTEMLRSVLLPSTTQYNARIKSSFEQILVIRTFN